MISVSYNDVVFVLEVTFRNAPKICFLHFSGKGFGSLARDLLGAGVSGRSGVCRFLAPDDRSHYHLFGHTPSYPPSSLHTRKTLDPRLETGSVARNTIVVHERSPKLGLPWASIPGNRPKNKSRTFLDDL
jgi:hypothetical protein